MIVIDEGTVVIGVTEVGVVVIFAAVVGTLVVGTVDAGEVKAGVVSVSFSEAQEMINKLTIRTRMTSVDIIFFTIFSSLL
jgi:hypothetical protein